jgi:hypothetical protein
LIDIRQFWDHSRLSNAALYPAIAEHYASNMKWAWKQNVMEGVKVVLANDVWGTLNTLQHGLLLLWCYSLMCLTYYSNPPC